MRHAAALELKVLWLNIIPVDCQIPLAPESTNSHLIDYRAIELRGSMAEACCNIFIQCLGRQSSNAPVIELAFGNAEETAVLFVDTLYGPDQNDMKLRSLRGIYLANNWKPDFAQAVFRSLCKAIETQRPMDKTLSLIYSKISGAMGNNGELKNDPATFHAVMALGVLMVETPEIYSELRLATGRMSEGKRHLLTIRLQEPHDANF